MPASKLRVIAGLFAMIAINDMSVAAMLYSLTLSRGLSILIGGFVITLIAFAFYTLGIRDGEWFSAERFARWNNPAFKDDKR